MVTWNRGTVEVVRSGQIQMYFMVEQAKLDKLDVGSRRKESQQMIRLSVGGIC